MYKTTTVPLHRAQLLMLSQGGLHYQLRAVLNSEVKWNSIAGLF